VKRYTVAVLLVWALACTDSNAPSPPLPPPVPPPPPPGASFAIQPALDTVLIDRFTQFVAEHADSTEDQWTVSDSSVARLSIPMDSGRAVLQGLRPGTVTITARHQGDSGQATLVIPPFAIKPLLDTVTVGQVVTYEANQQPRDSIHWSFSDSSLVSHRGSWGPTADVAARASGTVIITASDHGDTAHATLVIRQPQAGEWETIDLGLLDNHNSEATAINDDGTVLGLLYDPGPIGFVYKDGAMRRLPPVGDHFVSPAALSPSGKIAAIVRFYGGAWLQTDVVAVWDNPDAAPRLLSGEAGESPRVIGINDRGDVLVSVISPGKYDYRSRAVLWRDGVRVVLGDLGGDLGDSTVEPQTVAAAWNTSGQIVGSSLVRKPGFIRGLDRTESGGEPEWYHPYLWENGVMHDLGTLAPLPCPGSATATDCSWGVALDINSHGVVVGKSNGADGKTRAFIWQNGVMRDLGVSPGHTTAALAINDRGQVLGTIDGYPDPGPARIFLWDNGAAQVIDAGTNFHAQMLGPNGEVIGGDSIGVAVWQDGRLTDLGEGYATAVNGRGEIVGVSGGMGGGNRTVIWRKKP
jgi:probable HAF family extracellular repeat protein